MCMYNYSCNHCDNFVKTLQVTSENGQIILTIPEIVLENYQRIMLCIAQSIPATSTAETVAIQIGSAATNRYPLQTTEGADVYSYQLQSRKAYPITVSSDNSQFVLHPSKLKKSTKVLTTPTSNTPPTNAAVNSTKKGDQ